MKYLKLFEAKIPRKSIKNKKIDFDDIRYIFDNMLDYGFKVYISAMDSHSDHPGSRGASPHGHEILKYCNGFIKVSMDMGVSLDTNSKRIRIDADDMMDEINDRLGDSKFLFFNWVGETQQDRWNNRDPKKIFMVDYFLFLESGFKKGTTFQIPELKNFATLISRHRRKL